VGGISIYEMVANNPIFEQIQEAINDLVNSWKPFQVKNFCTKITWT
jgi:hypothetical protein